MSPDTASKQQALYTQGLQCGVHDGRQASQVVFAVPKEAEEAKIPAQISPQL